MFPVLFNDTSYIGPVPDYKYFKHVSLDDYNNYFYYFHSENIIWNFKKESIKYCELDCIALYQILSKFNQLIFNQFQINIKKYPTLPSLSFAIFSPNYNKSELIPMISGQVNFDIRKSYTGGAVDMYIPKNPNGKKIYWIIKYLFVFLLL